MTARETFRGWLAALGVSLGTGLLVVAPFFWLGNASGHDIAFHASSWLDAAGQWKEGILYPRWAEWANYGFGEPRFILYPPLSWMLGAALSLIAPWSAVPAVFIILAQTLAGVSSFALARRFLPRGASLAAAACYAANPYALLVIYMRSDFAELLACAVIPAALLAALQLCGLVENPRRPAPRATAWFALAFAAVWLSNAPAGVMASYCAALLFAWVALAERSWRPLLRGAGGLALGFGLASFYLLPAAYEQRWIHIAQILSPGLQPGQNFLHTRTEGPEHNLFNGIVSNVAILLMIVTAIAAIIARHAAKTEEEGGARRKLWRVLLLLSTTAAFLMFRPSAIFWEHLPKLRYLQFPWRWAAILAVPFAYYAAAAMERRRAGWIWGAATFAIIGGTATYMVQKAWWDTQDIAVVGQAIVNGQGFEGTDEYDPIDDDHYNLPQKAPRVRILPPEGPGKEAPAARIEIERWTAEERDVRVTSRGPLRVALRLLDYPAWRVEVNGATVKPQHAEATAQIILPLSPGRQRITVKFGRTPDRTWGGVISVMALCAVFGLLWTGRRPSVL